jgi:hypothetical protein
MPVQRTRGHRPTAPLLDAGEFRCGGPQLATPAQRTRRTAQQPPFRLCSRLVSTAAEVSTHDRAVDPCGRRRPTPVQRHAEVNLSLTTVLDTGEHGGGHQRPQRNLDGRESAVLTALASSCAHGCYLVADKVARARASSRFPPSSLFLSPLPLDCSRVRGLSLPPSLPPSLAHYLSLPRSKGLEHFICLKHFI